MSQENQLAPLVDERITNGTTGFQDIAVNRLPSSNCVRLNERFKCRTVPANLLVGRLR